MKQIDLTRVDLNLLTVFQVLMEERHVSRAAVRRRTGSELRRRGAAAGGK
jgi:hypothetical protein